MKDLHPQRHLGSRGLRAGLCSLLLTLGCGAPLLSQESPGPVLAQLQLRDQRLLIHSRDGETRFSITGRDGQVLAQGLSLEELGGRAPQLFQLYQRALVQRAGARPLDASLTPPREAPDALSSPLR